MSEKANRVGPPETGRYIEPKAPVVVGRGAFQEELDALRLREKAHTREGDAIAAARRRLPMVEVDSTIGPTGPNGPVTLLDVFEGRRQLIAYYFMWDSGRPAIEQCEGARSTTGRSESFRFCIRVTSPTPRSARAPSSRACAIATSWAGTCPGTRPSSRSMRS